MVFGTRIRARLEAIVFSVFSGLMKALCAFGSKTNSPSAIAAHPAHVELPPKQRGLDARGTQHREHLHNMSLSLMASDDCRERVRGALAVALAMCLTYKERRRARTLAEWALILDVLEDIETTEEEDGEDGDGSRVWYMGWVRDDSQAETVQYKACNWLKPDVLF